MAHAYVEAFGDDERRLRGLHACLSRRHDPAARHLRHAGGRAPGRQAAQELAARGGRLGGVRLDSGDLAALSRAVRALLDEAGLAEVAIVASGNLDEFAIAALLDAGAPIDGFGVGTRMGVADAPAIDTAYKLVAFDGRPVMKLSPGKRTLPGCQAGLAPAARGRASRATSSGLAEEPGPAGAEPLLETVMEAGVTVGARHARLGARACGRASAPHSPSASAGSTRTPTPSRRAPRLAACSPPRSKRELAARGTEPKLRAPRRGAAPGEPRYCRPGPAAAHELLRPTAPPSRAAAADRQPPRRAPPENEIGAAVPLRLLLARSDQLAIAASAPAITATTTTATTNVRRGVSASVGPLPTPPPASDCPLAPRASGRSSGNPGLTGANGLPRPGCPGMPAPRHPPKSSRQRRAQTRAAQPPTSGSAAREEASPRPSNGVQNPPSGHGGSRGSLVSCSVPVHGRELAPYEDSWAKGTFELAPVTWRATRSARPRR